MLFDNGLSKLRTQDRKLLFRDSRKTIAATIHARKSSLFCESDRGYPFYPFRIKLQNVQNYGLTYIIIHGSRNKISCNGKTCSYHRANMVKVMPMSSQAIALYFVLPGWSQIIPAKNWK